MTMMSPWSVRGSALHGTEAVALQLTVLALLSLIGTTINGLVFAVFYRRPTLRTLSNRFVLSLVFANLVCTLISIPSHILELATWLPTAGHQSLQGLTSMISLASVLSIVLISLDRYHAVNTPLHYSIIVTRRKSVVMIGSVWAVSCALSLPLWCGAIRLGPNSWPLNSRDAFNTSGSGYPAHSNTSQSGYQVENRVLDMVYAVILLLLGFVVPLIALCWLYLCMYRAALKNSARTRRQSLCSNAATEAIHPQGVDHALHDQTAPSLAEALTKAATAAAAAAAAGDNRTSLRFSALPHRHRASIPNWQVRLVALQHLLFALLWREEGRALRTTAMVILSFIGCWLPYFLCLVVDLQATWMFGAKLAAFTNVIASPSIYVYRNQVARREASRVLALLFCPCRKMTYTSSVTSPYPVSLLSERLKANSAVVSRRSSLVSSSESPRKGSAESNPSQGTPVAGSGYPTPGRLVVNWVRDGTAECQLVPREKSVPSRNSRASSTSDLPIEEKLDQQWQPEERCCVMRQRATTVTGALNENKYKRKSSRDQNNATGFANDTGGINHQTYPSLDFFDTGLEDFSRAASFSRFVYHGGVQKSCSQPSATTARRRRTSSFSRVLLSRHKMSKGCNPATTTTTSYEVSSVARGATSPPQEKDVASVITQSQD